MRLAVGLDPAGLTGFWRCWPATASFVISREAAWPEGRRAASSQGQSSSLELLLKGRLCIRDQTENRGTEVHPIIASDWRAKRSIRAENKKQTKN